MNTKSSSNQPARARSFRPVQIANLAQAPLHELFWVRPESSLLNEAKARLDTALRVAEMTSFAGPGLELLPEAA